uniref:NADH dehydrogenase subunit 6 n=1 Tax=Nisia atrovenosa TaxID=1187023 RepID=UPI002A7F11B9|nr:NADH dehydrogenase subunit 6 [Nisia atrovenosa]WOW98928.1 NADH dehydrogenase subunit 6 [Nisia atrovenosa]
MKMISLLLLILNSMNLLFLNSSMSIGLIIIIQTILISMKINMMIKNPWFSFIIFITMIGGMMIMFIYMSSIASNQKLKFSKKLIFLNFSTSLFFFLVFYIFDKEMFFYLKLITLNEEMFYMKMFNNEQQKSIIKFLSLKKFNLMIMITIILLITLMFTSWMNYSFKGPLKKTYE